MVEVGRPASEQLKGRALLLPRVPRGQEILEYMHAQGVNAFMGWERGEGGSTTEKAKEEKKKERKKEGKASRSGQTPSKQYRKVLQSTHRPPLLVSQAQSNNARFKIECKARDRIEAKGIGNVMGKSVVRKSCRVVFKAG